MHSTVEFITKDSMHKPTPERIVFWVEEDHGEIQLLCNTESRAREGWGWEVVRVGREGLTRSPGVEFDMGLPLDPNGRVILR